MYFMINPSNIIDVIAVPLLRHSSKRLYSLVYSLFYDNTFVREENVKRAHIVGKLGII